MIMVRYITQGIKKPLAAGLAATVLLAALTTAVATARNFSASEARIRTVFRPLILADSSGNRISCTLTLEGTFHNRTLAKVERGLIGYIANAAFDELHCTSTGTSANVRLRVLTETLPWHVRYISFSGRLPAITIRIRILRLGFDVLNVPILGTCKYIVEPDFVVGGPAGGAINEGSRAASMRLEEAIRLRSSTPFCPEMSGSSGATPITTQVPPPPRGITVTLI
jgi:hypothetical protein